MYAYNYSLSTDFVKACKGIENVRKAMDLQQVLQMHLEGNFMYYDFINYFVSAVIGKMTYKKNHAALVSQSMPSKNQKKQDGFYYADISA